MENSVNDGLAVQQGIVPVIGLLWFGTLMSVTGTSFWGLFLLGCALSIPVGNYFQRMAEEGATAIAEPVL